jgi:hypothetical protein
MWERAVPSGIATMTGSPGHGLLSHSGAAHPQIDRELLLVHGKERQIHSLDIALPMAVAGSSTPAMCTRGLVWAAEPTTWAAVRTRPLPKYTPRPGPHHCGGSCQVMRNESSAGSACAKLSDSNDAAVKQNPIQKRKVGLSSHVRSHR